MQTQQNRRWRSRVLILSLCISLTGCFETLSSDSYDEPEPAGPKGHEYRNQADAFAQEGQWVQAAELSEKAAQRYALSRFGEGSVAYNWGRAGDYLQMAGRLDEARSKWQTAAEWTLHYMQQADAPGMRSFWLGQAAEYLSKAGQAQQAQKLWQEAAQAASQEYAKKSPTQAQEIARDLFKQGGYLYKAGDAQAAATVLQSALPWAQQDWNTPRKPDDLGVPYLLNDVEGLLGEALLTVDKAQAKSVFERLLSRRDHPYTVDMGGASLWRAGQALQKAGERDFARRMYLAAAQTALLDWSGGSAEVEANYPVVQELRVLGFERDAVQVTAWLNASKSIHGSAMFKQIKAQLDSNQGGGQNTSRERGEMQLAEMKAQGYEYLKNQRLADAFWRRNAIWEQIVQQREQQLAADEREEQARLTRKQEEEAEEGSVLSLFIGALSSGLQAYAGARQSGATSIARTETALRAASQSMGGSSLPVSPTVAPFQAGGAQNSASADQAAAAGQQTYRSATHCVSRDRQTNTHADYLGNQCDFAINVKWFALDDKICSSGCMDSLKPHQARSSVNKLKGRIVHAACEYPVSPKNLDGSPWSGGEQYRCTR